MNMERAMNAEFRHMEHMHDDLERAMPKMPQPDVAFAKHAGRHFFADPDFSNTDTTTECHEGVCLIRKCVNGNCRTEQTDKSGHHVLNEVKPEQPHKAPLAVVKQAAKPEPSKKDEQKPQVAEKAV